MIAGAGDENMGGAGGSGEAPVPTDQDRLQQAYIQIMQMCTEQKQLMQELKGLRKGKEPNQGRPG